MCLPDKIFSKKLQKSMESPLVSHTFKGNIKFSQKIFHFTILIGGFSFPLNSFKTFFSDTGKVVEQFAQCLSFFIRGSTLYIPYRLATHIVYITYKCIIS